MLRKIYYLLTPAQRLLVRRAVFFPVDVFETFTGRKKKGLPPRGMIYTGTGDFLEAGERYLTYFIKFGGLKPDHNVLDVGCGIGRMAIPLTKYLTTAGTYEGFDILDTGINWCKKNITPSHPNFNFTLVRIKNDLYSSHGLEATEFQFPYKNDQFDFIFLTSVFTHMLPTEVENYVAQISRVLKKGGICFTTFFIYGNEATAMGEKPYFTFPVERGYYKLMNEKVESANVAFDYGYIQNKLAAANGLQMKQLIPGYWRDITRKSKEIDFQDIVVFRKDQSPSSIPSF